MRELRSTRRILEAPLNGESGEGSGGFFSSLPILSETKKSIRAIQEVLLKKGTILVINSSIFSLRSNKERVYVFDSKIIENGFLTNKSRSKFQKISNIEKALKPDMLILLGSFNTLSKEAEALHIPTVLIDQKDLRSCNSDYIIPIDIRSKDSFLFLTYLLGGFFEA